VTGVVASGSRRPGDQGTGPGSRYVGLLGRILDGLPTADMCPDWEAVMNPRGLSAPRWLHIVYAEIRRELIVITPDGLPACYTAVDLRSGAVLAQGTRKETDANEREVLGPFGDDSPYVVIFTPEPWLPYTMSPLRADRHRARHPPRHLAGIMLAGLTALSRFTCAGGREAAGFS
jgi:hypothetical protein